MSPLIVVDDAFEFGGRGIVITPSIPDGAVNKAATVTLRLCSAASGRIVLAHLRLVGGGSRYHWVLLIDEGTAKPPAGTVVFVERCEPVYALIAAPDA